MKLFAAFLAGLVVGSMITFSVLIAWQNAQPQLSDSAKQGTELAKRAQIIFATQTETLKRWTATPSPTRQCLNDADTCATNRARENATQTKQATKKP